MAKISDLKAAIHFGPGHFIQELMELREWTQADLADVLGVTPKHVNKILNDKQPISLEMAKMLGVVFETSPNYWINLDTNYRLWLDKEISSKDSSASNKAKIYERMPISDMVKKKWIPPFNDISELESHFKKFWDVESLDFDKIDRLAESEGVLTKKSEAFSQFNQFYKVTWYQMAMKMCTNFDLPKYSEKGLKNLFNELHKYTIQKNGISKFLKELNQVGVIFFVLPHLQKTYLDGAAFISSKKNPAVVYTGRYKRIDNFWFTVAHEIAHVLKHLGNGKDFILDNLKNKPEEIDEIEQEANDLAGEKLKHDEILEYLDEHLNYLTTTKVEECSLDLNIHQSIIIGKLAKDEKISYRHIHLYNDNVIDQIPKKYMSEKYL